MQTLIIELLYKFAQDEDGFLGAIDELFVLNGTQVYSALFHVFAGLDLPDNVAENQWHEVVKHHESMALALRRKVSIKTALFDYFCCIKKTVRNPKMIEMLQYEQTARLAKYDDLTGLLNRHMYNEALAREITRAERHSLDLSILFLDLDDFKKINDRYGHKAGDIVLKSVAEVIMRNLRNEDIAVRYGGEEIILLLPETSKKNAFILGERIRDDVAGLWIRYGGREINVTLSGGLASFPYDATDLVNIQENADKALYMAKKGGKNTICMFSHDMRRYVRVECNREIYVDELGFNGKAFCKARSRDISGGGLFFEADREFDPGTRVQVQIPLNPDNLLLLVAKVVRTKSSGEKRFETGASFAALDNGTSRQLFSYIFLKTHCPQVNA
ncbi:MAG: diguanylate cyclase [Pseudomonadota bacterium]